MKKRIITIMLVFALVLTAVPFLSSGSGLNAYAASKKTKSAIVYTRVIKHGNTAYCMVYDDMINYRLYKVDLKQNKVKLLKKNIYNPTGMIYKNGYIYYAAECGTAYDSYNGELFRIKAKTGKKSRLERYLKGAPVPQFVVGKKTIYYTYYKNETKKTKKMKLNGKSKKNAKNIRIKVKAKKSNAKGYRLKERETDDGATKTYLVKPDGSEIFLAKRYER